MEAALFGAFDFVAKTKWLQYVLIAFAVVGTLGLYLVMRDNDVRQKEKDRWLKKQAEEAAKVANTRRDITTEISNDSRRADEAVAAMPDVGGPSELRQLDPAVADELLGPARASPR